MRRRTAIRVISYLTAAIIALGATTWYQFNRAELYRRYTKTGYERAFAELCSNMRELDAALQKSVYATSPNTATAACAEIYSRATVAEMNLSILPFSTVELEQTSSFLSRAGDYAAALARKVAAGDSYTDEERENLRALSGTASLLADNLLQMQADIAGGFITMDELQSAAQNLDSTEVQGVGNTVGDGFRSMEQEFPEVPSLIYDGPFSQHLAKTNPKMLENSGEIGEDLAKKTAAAFVGESLSNTASSEPCDGTIPCWRICVGRYCVSVSKKGGEVLSVLCSRQPDESKMDPEAAKAVAKSFLEKRGYKNMAESYHIIQDNVLIVNFNYNQNGVIIYPDMIKIGIALDDGSLISFGAEGYVSSHYEREIPEVKVSAEQARQQVTDDLKILSEKLAIIPTDGKYEVFCHEFKCEGPDNRHYIVYVNAVTGRQEKILILLEDENGSLTL